MCIFFVCLGFFCASKSSQRKCRTRVFGRFENEFQLFENEFNYFWEPVSSILEVFSRFMLKNWRLKSALQKANWPILFLILAIKERFGCLRAARHIDARRKITNICALPFTTLQSMMNAKLSKQRFWHCHENGLVKTIQRIPHNLCVSVKSASLYWGLG